MRNGHRKARGFSWDMWGTGTVKKLGCGDEETSLYSDTMFLNYVLAL